LGPGQGAGRPRLRGAAPGVPPAVSRPRDQEVTAMPESLPRAVALPLAAGALAHIGPAATWLPVVRRRLSPRLAGVGHPRHVALTFDDGPDPVSTPRFLDALDGLGARATFFVLGDAVLRHPGVVRETVR